MLIQITNDTWADPRFLEPILDCRGETPEERQFYVVSAAQPDRPIRVPSGMIDVVLAHIDRARR